MYEIFEQLLQKYGVTTYQVSKATGISQSTFSNWKARRNLLSPDKAKIIADYFGVSLDYLMTGIEEPEKKESKLTPKDERDIEKKLAETLDQIVSGDGLMFHGEIMDERTRQLLAVSLRNTMESAKIAAKKFTPNKYKDKK
ncbi:helix-turn-helix domain-containing protein [Hungatella hathewayi]|uniref:helix-turn-helix domain-containing protein n=1 Tax=Hungatella hathewayi TaxID=154046 RepID=UPI0022E125D8|nr:helix-turn-helix transcriptional regulator [Hungatella hathewayi]